MKSTPSIASTPSTPSTLCPHCGIRLAGPQDAFHTACGVGDYCDTCRSAHSIAHTSVQDATLAIKCADIDTVYMALKMTASNATNHKTRRKLLQARLNKLTQLHDCPLPAGY